MRQQRLEEAIAKIIKMLDEGRERITSPDVYVQNRQRGELLKTVRKVAAEALNERPTPVLDEERRHYGGIRP